MKIVVVSDTHMSRMAKKLPDRLIRELVDADAILHAGDWMTMAVWDMLRAYAETYGVAGNNDGCGHRGEVRRPQDRHARRRAHRYRARPCRAWEARGYGDQRVQILSSEAASTSSSSGIRMCR